MSAQRATASLALDEMVCRGVATDVFDADHARRLLKELDLYVQAINESGRGRRFFANLQPILERHLYLSLTRLYEPHSPRNQTRSIRAATNLIGSRASELRIVDRTLLIDYLMDQGESRRSLTGLQDEGLSAVLVQHLDDLPKADRSSARPLDQALADLKRVRDKAIAHHDRVNRASLIVPAWPKLAELIDLARRFAELIARSYLSVSLDLERDASRPASSLRRLLESAGLSRGSAPGNDSA